MMYGFRFGGRPLSYWRAKGIAKFALATKRYWTIYPNESEYSSQSFWKGVNPWYSNWMVNRSLDVQNRNTRQYYNIPWNRITYPHLSHLSGGNTAQSMGQLAGSSWQFSRNMFRLYR